MLLVYLIYFPLLNIAGRVATLLIALSPLF